MDIHDYYYKRNGIEADLQITNKVFVYGTLKRGYGNNSLLKNSTFIGNATSLESTYLTFCNGGFPMTIDTFESDKYKIYGELYEINDMYTMVRLDMLESNGSLYTRDIKEFVCENTNEKMIAWIYLYNRNPLEFGNINLNIKYFIDKNGKTVIEWKRELIKNYYNNNKE